MSAATDLLEAKLIKQLLIDTPTFIALHSASPTDAMNQPEIAGGAYVRKPATWKQEGSKATLDVDIVWLNLPGVNIVAYSVWTAETGGEAYFHQVLTAPKTVPAGEAFTLPKGNVTITCD